MKKCFIVICFTLLTFYCFCKEVNFRWENLPPFGYLDKEEWDSLVKNYGSELHNVSVDCGETNIGVWYLEQEPDYEEKTAFGVKRAVFVILQDGFFVNGLCFETQEEITDNILYYNPYMCGVAGYAKRERLSIIAATKDDDIITFTDISPYSITTGAFEWSPHSIRAGSPFYFWDDSNRRVVFVDIYNEDMKSTFVPVKNPYFFYGRQLNSDDTERGLYICSTDGKNGIVLPNSIYEISDGKVIRLKE